PRFRVEETCATPRIVRPFATLPEKLLPDMVSTLPHCTKTPSLPFAMAAFPELSRPTLLPENVTPETFERVAPLPELPENWLPVMLVPLNEPPENPRGLGRAAVPVAFVPILLLEMFAPLSLEMLRPVVFPEMTLFVMGEAGGRPAPAIA